MFDTRVRHPIRSVEDLADAKALRAVISSALAHEPIDTEALQVAVWNFVGTERRAGVPPALVIKRLTGLMDDSPIAPTTDRQALTHRVILWCVEEYFGCLGADVLGIENSPPSQVKSSRKKPDALPHLRLVRAVESAESVESSSATTLEMPAPDFAAFRDTPLWAVVAEAINELIAVGDLSTNTGPDTVIGYLCRELVAAKLVASR